jgi:gamma-glutamylcyclotransferase (GGCT)/AIG2-like uncharacterized protein YtfP
MTALAGGEELVFVYGTLRRGYGNHYLLEEGARLLDLARTAQAYALYALEIPFAIKDQAVSTLRGEIYAVTPECLARLDELEEHPTWYRRELVEVVTDQGDNLQAWLYFYPEPRGGLVPSGDYARHAPPELG